MNRIFQESMKIIFLLLCSVLCGTTALANEASSVLPENVLGMSLEDMMNVKISTAGKKSEKIVDIPASAVIISRKDIEKYGYMSLEEILENVPGVYGIDDYGPYRKTFGVRGFYAGYPRNIIFLVNGVSQSDGVFDYNVMANFSIPVEAIDRIEVVRGPMSVMYGQGAFFGAINIITNDAYDDTDLAAVSLGNMSRKTAAKITGNKGEGRFSISAGYTGSQGPAHPLDQMTSDMPALLDWNIDEANDTTDHRLEREAFNFIFSGKYKKIYADLQLNKSTDELCFYKPSYAKGSCYRRESVKAKIGFESQVSESIKLDTSVVLNHFDFETEIDLSHVAFPGEDAGGTTGEANMLELELDSFIDVNEAFDLTTGLYLKFYDNTQFHADTSLLNSIYDDATGNNIWLWAAFIQASYQPCDKLRLVGGLRPEQMFEYTATHDNRSGSDLYTHTEMDFDEDDIELTSNIAAIYSANDHHIFKFMYGEAIARPSFFQTRDQLANGYPALESERIKTLELNYMALFSSDVTLSMSLFHNVLDNLIVRTAIASGGNVVTYNTNDGNLMTNGVEISLQVRPVEKLLADLSVTYQETEDKRAGYEDIDVAYSPHLLGYAKLSYGLTNNAVCSLTGTYVGAMETQWDESLNNGAGGRIGEKTEGYFMLGANLRIRDLYWPGVYLNLRCSNLLNKKYFYPTYVTNTWADLGTMGNSREFLVTLGMKF